MFVHVSVHCTLFLFIWRLPTCKLHLTVCTLHPSWNIYDRLVSILHSSVFLRACPAMWIHKPIECVLHVRNNQTSSTCINNRRCQKICNMGCLAQRHVFSLAENSDYLSLGACTCVHCMSITACFINSTITAIRCKLSKMRQQMLSEVFCNSSLNACLSCKIQLNARGWSVS